jgi:hypothetical protein
MRTGGNQLHDVGDVDVEGLEDYWTLQNSLGSVAISTSCSCNISCPEDMAELWG